MTEAMWLLAAAVVALAGFAALRRATIRPGEVGLLYRNGRFEKELGQGRHYWLDPLRATELARVSTLPQSLLSAALEVMSKDQFAFRLTATVLATVTDARAMHEGTPKNPYPHVDMLAAFAGGRYDRLHPLLAAATMEAVGALTLEEFLAAPAAALDAVAERIAPALPGTRVDGVLVTAVTLPPELRKMFTEVERARREGLAQLERARGEQAALRALANAARNLADNPQLAQLRLLQTMENAKGAKTFVLGRMPEEAALPAGGDR